MNARPDYRGFLEAKIKMAEPLGFDVALDEINPALKDFARVIVQWAAKGGRRGIFSSFGLHKTSCQLELARLARVNLHAVPLIVLPLGVRQEFFDDAEKLFTGRYAIRLKFIRTVDEMEEGSPDLRPLIYVTNYEPVRDGKLDVSKFGMVSLDEGDVLRGFGGTKTFREFMRLFEQTPLRFVATATPDPNEFIELLSYAAFLGIMDVGQAKTRFFKRNSEKADELTLHPHKEREFWLWVASWALFVTKPSDLGFSDDGYNLPPVNVRWHEVPTDHSNAGAEKDGQGRLLKDAAVGVQDAARERRESLGHRLGKLLELRAERPGEHRIEWHDLEAERTALEKAIPGIRSIFGSQDSDLNEQTAIDFKYGRFADLATKPEMSGAGCNFQKHCHIADFLGIGFKFREFIQAFHRLVRFGQEAPVEVNIIYSEAEREKRRRLERRWKQHDEQRAVMSEIIKTYGLANAAVAGELARTMHSDRVEVNGERFTCVNNDCVEETRGMPENSVDLIVTSIPFSMQYEYTPKYNDFGHTDDDAHFFRQMDFLTPELLRVLRPGRICAIHCKDRVIPGGMTGLGFQTIAPFGAETMFHFRKHGFAYLGTKTIVTDVVRENNQTYRLGWSEQCKDGTRMGFGLPEYLHVFRKPPTDGSNGYADLPVVKDKDAYTRGRWQFDAHGFGRSSGNRFLRPTDLIGLEANLIFKRFKAHSLNEIYDFEVDVALADALDKNNQLPPTFMLLQPQSWHPDVWTDVTRMRTLNGLQHAKGKEMHLCPLQFDIVDRAIVQYTNEGELVYDPFGGLMTVPYCAVKLKRRGLGVELSETYFRDGVAHCQAIEAEMAVPTLFDLMKAEEAETEAA